MPPAERTNAETGEKMQKIYGEKIQNTLTEMNPNPHHLYSYSRSFSERHVWSVRAMWRVGMWLEEAWAI